MVLYYIFPCIRRTKTQKNELGWKHYLILGQLKLCQDVWITTDGPGHFICDWTTSLWQKRQFINSKRLHHKSERTKAFYQVTRMKVFFLGFLKRSYFIFTKIIFQNFFILSKLLYSCFIVYDGFSNHSHATKRELLQNTSISPIKNNLFLRKLFKILTPWILQKNNLHKR